MSECTATRQTGPERDGESPDAWRPGRDWSAPRLGTLDVWSLDLADGLGETDLLDERERARAERFLLEPPRLQFSRARAGLRRILGWALGRDPREVAFEIGPHGRPSLPRAEDVGAHGAVDFNLSHSGEQALVAVSFTPAGATLRLGVDVEEERTRRPLDRLAERFFAAPEVVQYGRLPDAERVAGFYRAWTRKEAYLKAWGTGLTFSSRRFAIDLGAVTGAGGDELLQETEMPGDDGVGWRFVDLVPAPGYRGALCFRGEIDTVRRFALEPFDREAGGPTNGQGAP